MKNMIVDSRIDRWPDSHMRQEQIPEQLETRRSHCESTACVTVDGRNSLRLTPLAGDCYQEHPAVGRQTVSVLEGGDPS